MDNREYAALIDAHEKLIAKAARLEALIEAVKIALELGCPSVADRIIELTAKQDAK